MCWACDGPCVPRDGTAQCTDPDVVAMAASVSYGGALDWTVEPNPEERYVAGEQSANMMARAGSDRAAWCGGACSVRSRPGGPRTRRAFIERTKLGLAPGATPPARHWITSPAAIDSSMRGICPQRFGPTRDDGEAAQKAGPLKLLCLQLARLALIISLSLADRTSA